MTADDAVAAIGARTLRVLRSFGRAALFFADLLLHIPGALRRFGLVVRQIHAIGNLSLLIIMASGLARRCARRWPAGYPAPA